MSSNRTIAEMYLHSRFSPQGKTRGDGYSNSRGKGHLVHKGVFATVHSTEPPPVEQYEQWLTVAPRGRRGWHTNAITPAKLRRMVYMKRNGCSYREIGESVGLEKTRISYWLKALPEGLAA
jgi:hypothetical protein